ncbi:MAG: DUF3147 domain-containing protein [Nitrospiraceae bacterium]
MSEVAKYGLYFLIGGLVVSVSSYLGAKGEGFLAAFASTFPAMTGVTFMLIHLNGSAGSTLIYAKHLLWFVPPWLAYVGFMIFGLNRFGFWPTMIGSLALYMSCVGLLRLALR